jgi:hypothetical protein
MSIILQRTQVAAQLEATEFSKATLAAADAFLAFNPAFTPSVEMFPRDPVRESLSKYPSVSGKRSAKIAFDVELIGSGTAGTAPFWGKLMKACGFSEVITGGVSVAYTPSSDNQGNSKSVTVGLYMDSMVKRIWGARGTVKLTMEVGKPGILHFEFTGCDFEAADVALLSSVTYSTLIPPAFLSGSLTLDSYAALCSKVELDVQNVLALKEDISSASGNKGCVITGRNPKGSMDPELCNVATYDFYTKWKTPGTFGSLSLAATGSAGNIATVTCPKVRYAAIADQDRNGLRALGLDFEPTLNTGDDEIAITMT